MVTLRLVVFLSLLWALVLSPILGQEVKTIAYDFSQMYESLNSSIVKIHVDSGHGSGFLVSGGGLIATNHHVVRNSRLLAVQLADGRKVKAVIVTLNPRYDLALLKINASLVSSLNPLPLLPQEKDSTVKAGVPVVAFGSPLSQTFLITQGIISKVEERVLLGDFLIEPGNSGGPLVNLHGEVVGINTFGIRNLSGAVRVTLLRDMLESPSLEEATWEEPPADLLPLLSSRSYPTELLRQKIIDEKLDRDVYEFDGGKFVVTAITPVLIGKLHIQDDLQQANNRYKRRGKKISDPSYHAIDAPFYDWHRNAIPWLDYAITFEVKPDFGSTTGSKWALALSAIADGATAYSGGTPTAMSSLYQTYEFKAEFLDFKIYRDGKLIEPVWEGRAITESSFRAPLASFVDEAYSGMYTYAPEEFMTGEVFEMRIVDAREPNKIHKSKKFKADSKLIRQLRSDFEGASETLD